MGCGRMLSDYEQHRVRLSRLSWKPGRQNTATGKREKGMACLRNAARASEWSARAEPIDGVCIGKVTSADRGQRYVGTESEPARTMRQKEIERLQGTRGDADLVLAVERLDEA